MARVRHTLDPLDDRDTGPARERRYRHDPAHQHQRHQHNQERANLVRDRLKVSEVVGTSVTLKKAGAEWIGLCPFHGEKTPSFTVNDRKGFWHCFGCSAHGDAIAFVMQHRNRSFVEALDILESENGLRHLTATRPAPPPPPVRQVEDRRQDAWLEELWRATEEVRAGSVVDRYLRGPRALLPPAEYGLADPAVNAGWPADLRCHPELWHKPSQKAWPAMILPYRKGGPDGAIVALHRTWLQRDGSGKAPVEPAKMHVGPRKGALIYLSAIAGAMTAGEGLETTLSCMQLFRLPGFCYGSADAMAEVEPPFLVERLLIGADWNRQSRTGEKAADAARKKFSTGGRQIRVRIPDLRHKDKADFNDVVILKARGEWPPQRPLQALLAASTTAPPRGQRIVAAPLCGETVADCKREEAIAFKAYSAAEEAVRLVDRKDAVACHRARADLAYAKDYWARACARTEAVLRQAEREVE